MPARTARQSLNKAYLKAPVQLASFEAFKHHFEEFSKRLSDSASEEFNKNELAEFLKTTYYSPTNYINVSEKIDLAIHIDDSAKSPIGVLIETKRRDNASEMPRKDMLNSKALQELLLYYLRERIDQQNIQIRSLIITNFEEWFVFDAHEFDRSFFRGSELPKRYRDFSQGRLSSTTTDFFYREIADPAIAAAESDIQFTYFTTSAIASLLHGRREADWSLVSYYKIFSPQHLLKLPFENDNNTLNRQFYDELLHIIGIEEVKDGSKRIIRRRKDGKRDSASLLENTIAQLQGLDKIASVANASDFGDSNDDRLFGVGLELVLTWVNRIIFLKLLEAQLLRYNDADPTYAFLKFGTIRNYGELNQLFFQVLAEPHALRMEGVKARFKNVPYLNSSLFEISDLERQTLVISNLIDGMELRALSKTVFKDAKGKAYKGCKPALAYLFEFLDAYNFASEGGEDIQSDKALISSSVLGLIYEKINGYRDGSYYTPGFITMSMTHAAVRQAVIKNFSEQKGSIFSSLTDVYNSIDNPTKASQVIDGVHICDPAVGSGHFLVSALNELVAIKSELGLLFDSDGKRLKNYAVTVENDELVVCDENGDVFQYKPKSPESHRVQEALFNEKRNLIESCLFGVDINKNSVNICRLRLWIELLKHSFYKDDGTLETLPNLDINIKCGNSLVSRFALESDLKAYLRKNNSSLAEYRAAIRRYQNASVKAEKREMADLIQKLKTNFRTEMLASDPILRRLDTAKVGVKVLEAPQSLFDETEAEKKNRLAKRKKLQAEIERLETNVADIAANKVFEHSFEWRLEFPEILNNEGTFVGFDVVIGNPPYVSAIALKKSLKGDEYKYLKDAYSTAKGTVDLFVYFFELAGRISANGASICYICPNRYLSANYGAALRAYLIEYFQFLELSDYSAEDVFEEAATYPVITHLKKGRLPRYDFQVSKKSVSGVSTSTIFSSELLGFAADNNLGFLLSDKYEITKKIYDASESLTCVGEINATSTAAEADAFGAHISEAEVGLKLLNTGNIDRYCVSWGAKQLTDSGKRFLRPRLPEDAGILGKSRLSLYRSQKIVFAKIAIRAEAFFDELGEYASINTNCIHSFRNGYDPLYVLGWVNSRLFQYVYECFFDGLRMEGRYLSFAAPYLSNMCIRRASAEYQATVAALVRRLIDAYANNSSGDSAALEAAVDREFYLLYGLRDDEISKVEGAINSGPTVNTG
jgi:adenine-specific DNA-methyltransferase